MDKKQHTKFTFNTLLNYEPIMGRISVYLATNIFSSYNKNYKPISLLNSNKSIQRVSSNIATHYLCINEPYILLKQFKLDIFAYINTTNIIILKIYNCNQKIPDNFPNLVIFDIYNYLEDLTNMHAPKLKYFRCNRITSLPRDLPSLIKLHFTDSKYSLGYSGPSLKNYNYPKLKYIANVNCEIPKYLPELQYFSYKPPFFFPNIINLEYVHMPHINLKRAITIHTNEYKLLISNFTDDSDNNSDTGIDNDTSMDSSE